MAKPKQSSRTVFGIGFLRAPDGNIVAVRGLMDFGAMESLSPVRTDADMASAPVMTESEPDNMGRVSRKLQPMMTQVGEHRVHGQRSDRTAELALRALRVLLERAIHGKAESVETLDALLPPVKAPKARPTDTAYDKWLRAERALDFLGKSDAFVRDALRKKGREQSDIDAYLKQRTEFTARRRAA